MGSMTFVPGAPGRAPRAADALACTADDTALGRPSRVDTSRGGSLSVLGFYYTRIAYYAYRGYAGYSYDDIPEVD